jgi:hypothetical protein
MKDDNERLELWCQLYAYITVTSLPLWDRFIFVAQSVQDYTAQQLRKP